MDFLNYLIETYGYNEVINIKEISYKNYSRPWIDKEISKLCKEEKLIRFEKGIYYLPTETELGKSLLDPHKVILKKYIYDGKDTIGYFSGATFMNMLGISNQMPNVLEIYTNNEPSRVREIPIGKQKVIVRRSRVNITSKNAATLSFLELMNFTDASFYNENRKKIIKDFIAAKKITRQNIKECVSFFPDKALRTLVESGIIYDVTQ